MRRQLAVSIPFALVAGLGLVLFGAVVATAPSTAGSPVTIVIAAVTLFAAISYVGAAIRRHRRQR